MKNLFLITICFAMCGAMVASADTGVIAKSDIETIVDVGMADVFADAVNPVSFISTVATFDSTNTIHSINLPEAVAYELAEDVGWRYECDDYKFATNKDSATADTTDPVISRRARDGLSC